MAKFTLVAGAWLGGWAWDRVASLLRSSGHEVNPLTLPGLADRASELTPETGLMAHVNDVVSKCGGPGLRGGIIVGHSYAGAVVGAAVRRAPRSFAAQVYLDTLPLDEGSSLLDGFPPEGKKKFDSALRTAGGVRVWPMPEDLGAQAPVEGLSKDDLELLHVRGTPQPALTFEERLSGKVEEAPYPGSHAISCVEDEKAAQEESAVFLKSHPGWTYHSLPICHWPMLSSPKELASILDEIAAAL